MNVDSSVLGKALVKEDPFDLPDDTYSSPSSYFSPLFMVILLRIFPWHHLSFVMRQVTSYWIDQRMIHKEPATSCCQLLSLDTSKLNQRPGNNHQVARTSTPLSGGTALPACPRSPSPPTGPQEAACQWKAAQHSQEISFLPALIHNKDQEREGYSVLCRPRALTCFQGLFVSILFRFHLFVCCLLILKSSAGNSYTE